MARAAGVRRVIMTSSTATIVDAARDGVQDERDWVDPDAPTTSVTTRVKVQAERAAWDYAQRHDMQLTVINPGLILGPPLDRHYGASVAVISRILAGGDPMVPLVGLAFGDVRDVAEMHLRAMQRPMTAGKRYIGVAGTMTLPEIARLIKQTYPRRRIATLTAPRWLLQLYTLWDPQVQAILPMLGHIPRLSNLQARQDLGMAFASPADTVKATADWLVRFGQVQKTDS